MHVHDVQIFKMHNTECIVYIHIFLVQTHSSSGPIFHMQGCEICQICTTRKVFIKWESNTKLKVP